MQAHRPVASVATGSRGVRRQKRSFNKGTGTMETSEETSRYGNMVATFPHRPAWADNHSMGRAGMWHVPGRMSWLYPKALRGKGFEYRKFFGLEQLVTPHYTGGPLQAVHDENRNNVFHREWDFPADLRTTRWPDSMIRTKTQGHYIINHFSKPALQQIAARALELSRGQLIHNPYHPSQPVRGPVEIPVREMENYRRQAFLAGVQFPEFPDIQAVDQVDPWEQDEENAVPDIENDKLLDKEMWAEINKNMAGMESKVKAFKDSERKKQWAWKMSLLMQQLKRARQEEAFIAKQATRVKQKTEVESSRKPWERARMAADKVKKDEDVSEEFEVEGQTDERRKELQRYKRRAGGHRPPGSKL
ncbi:hypothetical protein DIPPA_21041 [Diplonema papillatum]|nr:hypothetical protein DIPPA_21041 [Diplonema papillatum]